MKYEDTYVSKDKQIAPLNEVLKQWLVLNNRYYKVLEDIVSCYTELSSVSHFNAAAWSCSNDEWVGLQEYQSEKRLNSRGRRKIPNGRIDLYLSNADIDFVIEAKNSSVNLKDFKQKKLNTILENKVWDSWNDARKLRDQKDAEVILSMTFFDFQSPSADKKKALETLKDFIKDIPDNRYDAGAYWFLKEPIIEENQAYYGTYLIIEKYFK